ncbi:MAG: glycine cleavage system aminomethyltransferase GcvT [Pseudomonadota bacterium]
MPRRTPLHDEHLRLGAKMVDFAGWEMPVQYTGVIDEHLAVRKAAGLFDVSHMGEIEIAGPDAEAQVNLLTTNDVTKMTDGRAQYSILCNERGTVVDDIIVYRFESTRYIIVVNASNTAKDFAWCKAHIMGNATIRDLSDEFALIAFQGPKAPAILQGLTDISLDSIAKYHFRQGPVAGKKDVLVARTGYTGEDGFELFVSPADAAAVWQALLEQGKSAGVKPAGLGCRDTLRLEMKYSLYGHEITEETNPIEAGLGWVVKLGKSSDFIGKALLVEINKRGLPRKLAGFKMVDRGIPRQGYTIMIDGKPAGIVTSGTMSPSLGVAIGIGYVPAGRDEIGNKISIDIRGQEREAVTVETPFYKK